MDASKKQAAAEQSRNVYLGILFSLFATAIWSSNFIIGRALSGSVPPISLAFFRWLVATIVILPIALPHMRQEWQVIRKHWRFFLVISFIGVTLFNTLLYAGAKTVPALNMSLIAISSPLFTLIMSWLFFHDPMPMRRLVGVGIVLLGVVYLIVKGSWQALLTLSFSYGDLLVVAGAFSFAVYTVMVRKKPQGISPVTFLGITFSWGLAMLFPFFLWEYVPLHTHLHFDLTQLLIFIHLGVGPSIIAYFAWNKAIYYIGPVRTSIIYYILPLFCGVEAILFLGEPVEFFHFVSGACILGGLILATKEVAKPSVERRG